MASCGVWCSLLSLCSIGPSRHGEQSAIKAVQAIDEVVVTGTGTEHYLKSAPVQTEVITGRMLRSFSGRSFGDILAALCPSFDIAQSDMGPVCR